VKYFVKLGWLTGWMEFFPKEEQPEVFSKLEEALNTHASKSGGLNLSVTHGFPGR
jgi:hypothetical protein